MRHWAGVLYSSYSSRARPLLILKHCNLGRTQLTDFDHAVVAAAVRLSPGALTELPMLTLADYDTDVSGMTNSAALEYYREQWRVRLVLKHAWIVCCVVVPGKG